jgi:hypothetical protein
MNPPKIKIIKGNPGVTQVSGVVQYSAESELCITILSLFFFPIFFSKEKQYLGFFDLYPRNMAKTFFDVGSSKSRKIFSFLKIRKELRIKLIIIGDTESMVLLTKIEKGLIAESENVAIGAKDTKTINPNASAPPNNPNLHSIKTNGAIINEKPIPIAAWIKSGSRNKRATEITPKIIHNKSDISRFRISMIVAKLNITRARIIRTWKISISNMI